jgi:membrane protease YdiL (CAAX protease family)
VTIAPLVEELMFRGFALRVLTDARRPFWLANTAAAAMFLGLHLPGWYFAGGLGASRVVSAVSIVLIGLVAGLAKRRAGSTWASVAFHFVNNLYAAFVK